ncbi:MAG TPA: erythromycin esterase family protein [Thermoanaerobaculia bacterium]
MRKRVLIALLLLATTATAQRHRAAAPEPADVPASWLAQHAAAISVEPNGSTADLAALRHIVGDATTVALGDATHGTHEFMAVKLRMVQFLVQEMGFQTLAVEGSFPTFNRLNEYVVHGNGNPRELLLRAGLLGYSFWDSEEFLAVVEWLRQYNATRGDKPPVELAGFDLFEEAGAASDLIWYLTALDAAAAQEATRVFGACRGQRPTPPACRTEMRAIYDRLAARRDELVARTSPRAFDDALQNARIAARAYEGNPWSKDHRDAAMAANVRWIKEHRGPKLILWGHQEHLGRTVIQLDGSNPMGRLLANTLGDDYVVIGTCAWSGSFEQYLWSADQQKFRRIVNPFRPATEESHEAHFRAAGKPALLIPLRREAPEWLKAPRTLRVASTYPSAQGADWVLTEVLPDKLDATVYVELTTPLKRLAH